MDIIWYLTFFGAMKSSLGDFFSDLEELNIEEQLRELDEMMNGIDNENNIGDLKLDDISKLFSDDCVYKCSNGAKPVPRKGHVPKSNGCGSFGLTLDTKALPEMTKCCDKHDYCYDTCNTDRQRCDDDFKLCLGTMCDRLRPNLNKKLYDGCKETADLIYTGTSALGCTPFLSAQENACDCSVYGGDKSSNDKFKKQSEKSKKTQRNTEQRNSKHENRGRPSDARVSEPHSGNKKIIDRYEEL